MTITVMLLLLTMMTDSSVVVSALVSISVVNRHWPWMGDHLRAGKPSRYVTSHLGQLSFPSLQVG